MMEVIGLTEITELPWEDAVPWFPDEATESLAAHPVVNLGRVSRMFSAGAAAFALSLAIGHSGAGGAVAPRSTGGVRDSVASVAESRQLAPLAKTTLDDAWQSAVSLLEANGQDVHKLTTGAAARVNAWRAIGVAAFPDTDDSDEG